ncbi:1291_t:CDS:2 [Funneliformis caledonium]|uniref:1291_t:CDS:1 n=1 Tax=Funneliformis caledonium TaxID=1117310 RepID=A0A9N8VRD8_9GLOM|nr:1291_t:CDS:2 [Funneliformis caledonium]
MFKIDLSTIIVEVFKDAFNALRYTTSNTKDVKLVRINFDREFEMNMRPTMIKDYFITLIIDK